MNDEIPINDTPETLKGCLWALGTGTTLLAFVMLSWLGIQRAEVMDERYHRKVAEIDLVQAQTQVNDTIASLNQQITEARTAQVAAQTQLQSAVEAKVQAESAYAQAKAQCDQDDRIITYLKTALTRSR